MIDPDNDLPFEPRIITDEEAETFPKHDQPRMPVALDDDVKIRKIDLEKDNHPAFAVREQYRNRGEKVD